VAILLKNGLVLRDFNGATAPGSLGWLAERKLLGPHVNLVHACNASHEELRAVADAGASLSVTAEVEMQMGMGAPAFRSGLAANVTTALGTDIPSSASSDLFSAMRFTLQTARGLAHLETLASGNAATEVPFASRDVLDAVTAAGARALGLGSRTGRIAEGLEADLVVLRTDDFISGPSPSRATPFSMPTRPMSNASSCAARSSNGAASSSRAISARCGNGLRSV